jgi:hypothetical protein
MKNTASYPQFMVFLPLIKNEVSGTATESGSPPHRVRRCCHKCSFSRFGEGLVGARPFDHIKRRGMDGTIDFDPTDVFTKPGP